MAKGEDEFEDFMYGPVLVPIAALGIIGNILSVIVYSRPSMKKSAINIILIGLFLRLILFIWEEDIMGCQLHNAQLHIFGYCRIVTECFLLFQLLQLLTVLFC